MERPDGHHLPEGKIEVGKETEPPKGHWRAAGGAASRGPSATIAGDAAPSPCNLYPQHHALPLRPRLVQRESSSAGQCVSRPGSEDGPQWLSPPPAGGSTEEDQTPCSSRDRHTYWANRGFAPPTTVARGGHVGACPPPPQPHSQFGQSSVPPGPAQLRISVLSASQLFLPPQWT